MNELWCRLRILLRRGRFDRELDEEMRFATLLAARRAMSVDPVVALRHE